MVIYIYLKSGKHYECVPQIRLTCSKNGTTGTAIFEINFENINFLNSIDPLSGVALIKENSLRKADLCEFIWSNGKPIKLIAIFIFASASEKQDFFNYYPYYALVHKLFFFPVEEQEKKDKN